MVKSNHISTCRSYLQVALAVPFIVLASYSSTGQDLSRAMIEAKERMEDPLQVSGSLAVDLAAYQTSLPVDRAMPLNGKLRALLNLSILGVNTPFSFLYSSGGIAFNVQLPSFAFVGISPRYQDYTLHLGDRMMNMGKYSFSNHSFRGVGFEVQKRRWYGRSFLGRLQRAQSSDFAGFQNVNTLFRRLGYGALVGHRSDADNFVEISLFKGWDDENSLQTIDSAVALYPSENVIGSIKGAKSISQRLALDFNYSSSGFTERSDLVDRSGDNFFRKYGGLLETNRSTRWSSAFEVGMDVRLSELKLRLDYERIDPGYRTLGALFFQDDQENLTVGLASQFAERKIGLLAKGGIQRNNLEAMGADEYSRFIGSINLRYQPSKKLHLNLNVSNFSSVNRQVRIVDPAAPHSLTELALTSSNISVNCQYLIDEEQVASITIANAQNQAISTLDVVSDQTNILRNVFLSYIRNMERMTYSVHMYLNSFAMADFNQRQLGVRLTGLRYLLDRDLRLQVGFSVAQNRQREGGLAKVGHLYRTSLSFAWSLDAVQSVGLRALLFANSGQAIDDFTETRAALSYQLRLSSK